MKKLLSTAFALGLFLFVTQQAWSQNYVDDVPPPRRTLLQNEKGTMLFTYHMGLGSYLEHEVRVERFFHPDWSLMYTAAYSYQYPSVTSSDQNYAFRIPLGVSTATELGAVVCCGS